MRVPSVQPVDAMPLGFAVEIAGFTDPPPSTTDHEISTPATGLLNWSATRTDSAVGSVVPTTPVWRSPPFSVIWVAPATVAVIVNVTDVRPAAPAVVVWVPGAAPSVRIVLACPFTSVCDVVGLTEPPPEATAQLAVVVWFGPVTLPPPDASANVTATPATGLPLASRTITAGATATAVPVVAVWLSPALTAIWVAAPAVTLTGADVTPVKLVALKPRVRGPTVPVMDRLLNTAVPAVFVVAVAVPPSVPPPDAITADRRPALTHRVAGRV